MKTTGMLSLALLITTIVLSACTGSSTPSESDGRVVFENKWKQELESDTVKLLRFEKVNAQSGEVMGIKFHKLEYEAEIEYPKWLNTHCKKGQLTGWDCWMVEIREKGEKRIIKGEITFEETEKGWKAPDGNVY